MRRFLALMGLIVIGGVALSACGGGSDHSSMSDEKHSMSGMSADEHKNAAVAPNSRVIAVRAKTGSFTPKTVTVKAGDDVAIELRSTDTFHDFVVQKKGHVVGANKGKTERGGLRIDEPGTYTFWCRVEGHRKAGMEGTIVVE